MSQTCSTSQIFATIIFAKLDRLINLIKNPSPSNPSNFSIFMFHITFLLSFPHFPFFIRKYFFPKTFYVVHGNIFYLCLCSHVKWMGRNFCLSPRGKTKQNEAKGKKMKNQFRLKCLLILFLSFPHPLRVSSSDE